MGDIIIIAAVDAELDGLKRVIELPDRHGTGNRNVLSGRLGNKNVRLIVSGPGMANTVQALTANIEHQRPDLIMQTGCAGAFYQTGFHTGDIGIADCIIDVQLGIESETGLADALPFAIMKQQDTEIRNRYPIDIKLVNWAYSKLQEIYTTENFGILTGPFASVATITATDNRAGQIHERYRTIMEEMEGAAAAHTSIHYGIPFLAVRCASNRVGKRNREEWNLPLAFQRSADAVYQLVLSMENFHEPSNPGIFHMPQ